MSDFTDNDIDIQAFCIINLVIYVIGGICLFECRHLIIYCPSLVRSIEKIYRRKHGQIFAYTLYTRYKTDLVVKGLILQLYSKRVVKHWLFYQSIYLTYVKLYWANIEPSILVGLNMEGNSNVVPSIDEWKVEFRNNSMDIHRYTHKN